MERKVLVFYLLSSIFDKMIVFNEDTLKVGHKQTFSKNVSLSRVELEGCIRVGYDVILLTASRTQLAARKILFKMATNNIQLLALATSELYIV